MTQFSFTFLGICIIFAIIYIIRPRLKIDLKFLKSMFLILYDCYAHLKLSIFVENLRNAILKYIAAPIL